MSVYADLGYPDAPDMDDPPRLHLAPGPLLYVDVPSDVSEELPTTQENLADQAHRYLFEPVRLEKGVTLADVLGLLRVCPPLQDIFWRDFATEVCAQLELGAITGQAQDREDGIEAIELGWRMHRHSHQRRMRRWPHMDVRGRGASTQGVMSTQGQPKRFSLSFTPLRELLSLPVELTHRSMVFEDDVDAKSYGDLLEEVKYVGATLGEVLDGLMYELTFHGSPLDTSARDTIQSRLNDLHAGTGSGVTLDDLLCESDAQVCQRLFDSLGGHEPAQVRRVIYDIEDDAIAAAALSFSLGNEVRLKPFFTRLTGRQLRCEYRKTE